MKKYFIFAVLLFSVVLFGCEYLEGEPVVEVEKEPEIEVDLDESVGDEDSDWVSYRNEKYGFEFGYPEDWEYKDVSYENNKVIELNEKGKTYSAMGSDIYGINVGVYKNNKFSSNEDYIEDHVKNIKNKIESGQPWDSVEKVKLNDIDAVRSVSFGGVSTRMFRFGKSYVISTPFSEGYEYEVYQQVLETFEFIDFDMESEPEIEEEEIMEKPDLSKLDFAYEKLIDEEIHIIYKGEDMGLGEHPVFSDGNLAFSRKVGDKYHVIYNGEDMSEHDLKDCRTRSSVILSGDNIVFERNSHIIYNGEDLGLGTSPSLSGDNLAFRKKDRIIFNGKDVGKSTNEPIVSGDNIIFVRVNKKIEPRIIYNGIDMGIGTKPALSDYNFAFLRKVDGENHVFHNGRDVGKGKWQPAVSGNNFAFMREVDGIDHIFYNEEDMGEGEWPKLLGDNIAFLRYVDKKIHVIFNGVNLGRQSIVPDMDPILLFDDSVVFKKLKNGFLHTILDSYDLGPSRENFSFRYCG